MRYLILSDVHANLEALEACLEDARARGFDRTLVLGDLVGYGADPNAVVERIQRLEPLAIIRGNHDRVALGLEHTEGFNQAASSSARWTLEALTAKHRAWLAALPAGPRSVDDLVEICHGSPADEDTYIFDGQEAVLALQVSARPLCLFGHTHYPSAFALHDGAFEVLRIAGQEQVRLLVEPAAKYLVNAGSVGQPRDGDPRAAYGIVNVEAEGIDLFRVDYDIKTAQRKILEAGLPESLARRLAAGR